jgi:type II secretory pathway component PulF
MNESSIKHAANATILWLTLHSLLWFSLFALAFFAVPRFKKIFMDFGVELPGSTVLTLCASDWVVDYFYLLPFVLAWPILADAAVTYVLYQEGGSLRRAWLLFMIALPALVVVSAIITLLLPLADLGFELSG